MHALSPVVAATEGLRVLRREPQAVLSWVGIWSVVLAGIAVIKMVSGGSPMAGGPGGWAGLEHSFGPLAVVLIPTLLILWIMTTATVFRAVISPGEHGWHLFKLGPDEARLALITAAGVVLVVLFGGAPALLLFVLVKPILTAAPQSGHLIVDLGTVATVCLELWIAVRLSLASVHTFAEGRFHVVGYWRLTRGYFWRLLGSYLLVFLQVVAFVLAVALLAVVSGWFAQLLGVPHGLDLARRAGLIILALVVAVMSGAFFVAPSLIIFACQAHAYRMIISRPWG